MNLIYSKCFLDFDPCDSDPKKFLTLPQIFDFEQTEQLCSKPLESKFSRSSNSHIVHVYKNDEILYRIHK